MCSHNTGISQISQCAAAAVLAATVLRESFDTRQYQTGKNLTNYKINSCRIRDAARYTLTTILVFYIMEESNFVSANILTGIHRSISRNEKKNMLAEIGMNHFYTRRYE